MYVDIYLHGRTNSNAEHFVKLIQLHEQYQIGKNIDSKRTEKVF